MYSSNITNDEINELELIQFEGEIKIITSLEEQEIASEELKKEKIIGFDTETRPSFKKGVKYPVSLLQLSTLKKAFLIRLTDSSISKGIKDVLSSAKIGKVGVAIEDDIKELKRNTPFVEKGFIRLEQEVKKVGIESNGLKKICGIVLKRRISKGAQVSNWEAEELTEKQIIYAATDAWISLKLLLEIQKNIPKTSKSKDTKD